MAATLYDVLIIGYGPVSQTLALMLGRQGRRVAVCERWTERYPLPRAVCIDHELYRVLSANGMGAVLPSVTHGGPLYEWFNAEWERLLLIDWSKDSISGGPEVNFVHQPTLEQALDQAVAALPTVDLHLGWQAETIAQDAELAHVSLRSTVNDATTTLSARYVIGCDGANSLVRETIGSPREDHGFEADWLVIDVLLKEGVTIEQLGIPAAGQYCNPTRPTTIVPAGVREGRIFRRWEFMRLPGEDVADLEREERVWELLAPWAGPGEVELVRHKVYNFRSLIATRWRDRRLLIAGDAAHVMPPFMGQGMCSGIRDSWNLAWKLALVLDGLADDRLLDSYQPERQPHVRQITDISIFLGKIICIPDPAEAARRDAMFLGGDAPPPPPFPQLEAGILHRNGDDLAPGAGLLSPHTLVEGDGESGRFDDVVGTGFQIIVRNGSAADWLDSATLAALNRIGARFASLDETDTAGGLRDLAGRLVGFMAERGWAAMIVRPDFYIYGGVAGLDGLSELARDLLSDLAAAGVRCTVQTAPVEKIA